MATTTRVSRGSRGFKDDPTWRKLPNKRITHHTAAGGAAVDIASSSTRRVEQYLPQPGPRSYHNVLWSSEEREIGARRRVHGEEKEGSRNRDVCRHYISFGTCKYGATCIFHHPQLSLNFIDIPPWSWPVRNRNAAAVNIETSSSRNVEQYLLQPGSYFESIWPPIFESRRNLRPPSTIYMHFHYNKQIEELPERPGEPECSYFLKTGHCKFKSDCKFHHPKSWIERLPPCNLNDKSLPLRPERKVCRYYGRYRICKFGRVCMFHHPQLCKTSSKARELKLC
ncbi:hypothetical protein JHK82_015553 [Glycine max]|nr:hypothetical protein JHK82_015553 [Glycine max]